VNAGRMHLPLVREWGIYNMGTVPPIGDGGEEDLLRD